MSMTATMPDRDRIEQLVRSILSQNGSVGTNGLQPNLLVNISARHCHLRQEDVETLFGPGYKLTELKRLYPGDRLRRERDGGRGRTSAADDPGRSHPRPGAVVQPGRIGVHRRDQPGHRTPGADVGRHRRLARLPPDRTQGEPRDLAQGVSSAPRGTSTWGRRTPNITGSRRRTGSTSASKAPCAATLEGLLVRTHPDWKLEVHIDTDEANACDLTRATKVAMFKAVRSGAISSQQLSPALRRENGDWLRSVAEVPVPLLPRRDAHPIDP